MNRSWSVSLHGPLPDYRRVLLANGAKLCLRKEVPGADALFGRLQNKVCYLREIFCSVCKTSLDRSLVVSLDGFRMIV